MSGRHVVQRKMNYDDLPCNESACETHPDFGLASIVPQSCTSGIGSPDRRGSAKPGCGGGEGKGRECAAGWGFEDEASPVSPIRRDGGLKLWVMLSQKYRLLYLSR